MTILARTFAVALLASSSAACSPVVGLSRHEQKASMAKSVMVVPASTAMRGDAGERVELSAWGFTRSGTARVWFGSTPATSVTVIDGWRVEVEVPAGAGTVDVCIENASGSWVLLDAFRYSAGEGVEHCWPSGTPVASIDAARARIAANRVVRVAAAK